MTSDEIREALDRAFNGAPLSQEEQDREAFMQANIPVIPWMSAAEVAELPEDELTKAIRAGEPISYEIVDGSIIATWLATPEAQRLIHESMVPSSSIETKRFGAITPVELEILTAFEPGGFATPARSSLARNFDRADPDCVECGGTGISPDSPPPRPDDGMSLTPCDCIWRKP